MENPDISSGEYNPSCGDSVEIYSIITNDIVSKITFTGKGCVISLAMASMITETSCGKTVDELLELKENDILDMLGFQIGPTRAKCALLPLFALKNGLSQYNAKD